MVTQIPARARFAVALLAPAPTAHVLEIGCGPGAAVEALLPLVPDGHVTAVDRSATAIERTWQRNEAAAAGRLTVLRSGLADLFLEDPRPVDAAFAINVNVFWTSDAARELAVVRHLLRPGAKFHVVYDGEGPTTTERVIDPVRRTLATHGFGDVRHTRGPTAFALSATRV